VLDGVAEAGAGVRDAVWHVAARGGDIRRAGDFYLVFTVIPARLKTRQQKAALAKLEKEK